MEAFFPILFVLALVGVVIRIMFRSRGSTVKNPVLGLLNTGGAAFSKYLEEDRAALEPLFPNTKTGDGYQVPVCNVLFIYGDIAPDGSIGLESGLTVRHIAQKAGAAIAVVASSNPAENIIAAARLPGPKQANMVWTLDRKGDALGHFFQQLFTRMKAGKSMPMAWQGIAPQMPRQVSADAKIPATICNMEAGQVRFKWATV